MAGSSAAFGRKKCPGIAGGRVIFRKGKAVASAGFRSPSNELGARAPANPGPLQVPGFVTLGGGCRSATAARSSPGSASAGTVAIDKTCAQAGINAMTGSP